MYTPFEKGLILCDWYKLSPLKERLQKTKEDLNLKTTGSLEGDHQLLSAQRLGGRQSWNGAQTPEIEDIRHRRSGVTLFDEGSDSCVPGRGLHHDWLVNVLSSFRRSLMILMLQPPVFFAAASYSSSSHNPNRLSMNFEYVFRKVRLPPTIVLVAATNKAPRKTLYPFTALHFFRERANRLISVLFVHVQHNS